MAILLRYALNRTPSYDSSQRSNEWENSDVEIVEDAKNIDLLNQNWIDKSFLSETWRYKYFALFLDEALPAGGEKCCPSRRDRGYGCRLRNLCGD